MANGLTAKDLEIFTKNKQSLGLTDQDLAIFSRNVQAPPQPPQPTGLPKKTGFLGGLKSLLDFDLGETQKKIEERTIVPKEVTEPVVAGAAQTATFGLTSKIPRLREREERFQKEAPLRFGAGKVGGFFVPGAGQAQALRAGTKVAQLGLRQLPKLTRAGKGAKAAARVTEAATAGALSEGARSIIEEGDALEAARQAGTGAIVEGAFGLIPLGSIFKAAKKQKSAIQKKITGTAIEVLQKPAPKLTTKEKLVGVGEREARILEKPAIGRKATPFREFAEQARIAINDAEQLTPMDVAGIKASQALGLLQRRIQRLGQEKDALIRANPDETVSLSGVREEFADLIEDRLGARIIERVDPEGNIRVQVQDALGRRRIDPSKDNLILTLRKRLFDSPERVSVREADDIKRSLRNQVKAFKQQANILKFDISDALVDKLADSVDDRLVSAIGKRFRDTNLKNRDLRDLSKKLERRLQEVVDPETGQRRMGASLLKSAIQSNADRGAKALFKQVKKETGFNLIQDAQFAEIAMKAVGDDRIRSLLQEAGIQSDLLRSVSRTADIGLRLGERALRSPEKRLSTLERLTQRLQAPQAPLPEAPFQTFRAGGLGLAQELARQRALENQIGAQ